MTRFYVVLLVVKYEDFVPSCSDLIRGLLCVLDGVSKGCYAVPRTPRNSMFGVHII